MAMTDTSDSSCPGVPSAQTGENVPVTIIQARKGWLAINWTELWHYRELLFFLTWRDIKVRYKQTVLGAAWAVIQPLFSMVIFSIIFGNFAKIPSDGLPYPIFVYAGLLPWTFFANSVSQSSLSLVAQANLLTKVYFPRLYIPTASIGVSLVDFTVSLAVYAGIMLWYGHLPGAGVLLLPLMILLMFLAAAGMGYLLSSVTILYRDFRHIIPFLMQVWMFASPVIYPPSLLPDKYQWLLGLNPMTGIIGGFRSALLNRPFDWPALGISAAMSGGLLFLGLCNFRRTERRFADIV